MELFDLVDVDDNVVGVTHKAEAHANSLLHRVVAIYVFNGAGDLFVQMHKKSRLYDHSVGGHVTKGESYDKAAIREGKEELGISQPLFHLANFYSDEGRMQHMFGLYECAADPSWVFEPNDEVEEIIPMSIADIRVLMKNQPEIFTGGFINSISKYVELKKLIEFS